MGYPSNYNWSAAIKRSKECLANKSSRCSLHRSLLCHKLRTLQYLHKIYISSVITSHAIKCGRKVVCGGCGTEISIPRMVELGGMV